MSRTKPIFYSALLLTGVNLLLRLVGTSFQVYLSRTIGAAGVGLLQLTMSVGSLAMVAGMGGIRTATMYLTAEELGRGKAYNVSRVLSGCFLYSILFSGSVGAILWCFAPQLAEFWIGDIRVVESLRVFAVFLPVTCLCGVMTGYFTAAQRIGTLAAVEVAEQLCSMGLTMTLLTFWAGGNAGRACLSVVLGSSLGAGLTLVALVILRILEHAPHGEKIPIARRLTQTALPLALADDLKAGINTTENLTVPKRLALCGKISDPLAAFGQVSGMIFPVIMFPAAVLFGLNELLIPELARCNAAGSQKRIHYLVRRGLRVALVYGIFFGGLLYLLARQLCLWLYKSTDAAEYLRWYALLVPMLYCDAITDAMTKGLGQQKICVRYNIITSLLDVIFLYLLLPVYGMEGYFISFLVTHLLNFALSLRLLLTITGQRVRLHILLLSVAAFLFSIHTAGFVASPVVRVGAYLALLGASLFLAGIIRREDIRWVREMVRRF